MNLGELKTALQATSHRSDLAPYLNGFVDQVSQRIGRRFGVMPAPLVADTDTNSVLTTHSGLYLYGGLREIGIYTEDVESTAAYERLYQMEVSNMNINYQGLDWAACCPPVMQPVDYYCEYEEPVATTTPAP